MLSKSLESNFKGYFIIASIEHEVVAWTYFFIDRGFRFHGLLGGVVERLYRFFPFKINTAFISSQVAEYNVFHIKNTYADCENSIIAAMMERAFAFFKEEKIKLVVIKDHITKYPSEYLHKNFTHVHFMPGTYLDFECVNHGCTCFNEYLMSLKKKYRSNIRNKINRKKDDLTFDIIPASALSEEDCARCHELYQQTWRKQKLKHERLTLDYFCACGDTLGDSCKMLIARAGGEIIGFAQLLESEDNIINVRMGMDYDFIKEYNLYYHLLYENIAYCLRMKKKRLYTSQTCYRPKLETGAKLMPLHTYVHFTNPILHKIFATVFARNCKCYDELIAADTPSSILAKYKICPY
jgi:predicted N-acyltransferase